MFGCLLAIITLGSLFVVFFGDWEIKVPALIICIVSYIILKFINDNEQKKETYVSPPKPIINEPKPTSPSVKSDDNLSQYDITEEDIIDENVVFTDDGIFIRKKWDGVKWTIQNQRVYVYKRKYHLDMGEPPRFHICKCSTINTFLSQERLTKEYRKSDSNEVWVKNLDQMERETKVGHLPLCMNCYKKMKRQYSWLDSKTDNVEFVRRVINKTYWTDNGNY